jgi:opacity protein-like surface antigen
MILLCAQRSVSPLRRVPSERGVFWSSFVVVLLALLAQGQACAQARDAAHQNIHFEVFGMGTAEKPNFIASDIAYGVTGGTSLDWRFGRFRPGGEIRGSYASYSFQSLKLISVGPKLTYDAGRFHPYADFLIGYGVGTFKVPLGISYTGNNSTVYSVGGGLDYALTRYWAVRVDYHHESWDFDAPDQPFHPQPVSLGVRYSVHTRSRNGP